MRQCIFVLFSLFLCSCPGPSTPSFSGTSSFWDGEFVFGYHACGAEDPYILADHFDARLEVDSVPAVDVSVLDRYQMFILLYSRGTNSVEWDLPFWMTAIRKDGTFEAWINYPGGTKYPVLEFRHITGKLGEDGANAEIEFFSFKDDETEYSPASPDCKRVAKFKSTSGQQP